MKPIPILLLLSGLIIYSCATNDQKQEPKSDTLILSGNTIQKLDITKTQIMKELSPSVMDTLAIDKKATVFYQPDSLQIELRIKEVGAADFRAGADDYIYYVNTSAEYLEKQGLPVLDAKNKKYLKFILADGKIRVIRLDTLEELWGVYLFDPKKQPFAADISMIEEEYKKYYQ
jgi:hypothetical protein